MSYGIADIDQATAEAYEALITNLMQTQHPLQDLRTGTAGRDLLIRPAAELHAVADLNNQALARQLSVAQMGSSTTTPAMAANLSANMGVTMRLGVAAGGTVIVEVTDGGVRYYLPSGMYFTASTGDYYVLQAWQVQAYGTPVTDPSAQLSMNLGRQSGGVQYYYFIVPVRAAGTGASYNIPSNTALEPGMVIGSGFSSASTYSDIFGGEDAETPAALKARLPDATGVKTLESHNAISALLMETFPSVNKVSVAGMGDPEMVRDRHNAFRLSAGGKIDVYARTSLAPDSVTLQATGTRQADGSYSFTVTGQDAPGAYLVRSVNAPTVPLTSGSGPAVGSYPFTESRRSGYTGGIHDIATAAEAYLTVWQEIDVNVTGIGSSEATLPLDVEVYLPRSLSEIQAFLDGDLMRNRNSDTVARGAVPCMVSVTIRITREAASSLDLDAMTSALAAYINGKGFGDVLTVSQMASVMHAYDIVSMGVDYQHGIQLQGTALGSDGVARSVAGSVLDVSAMEDSAAGVTPRTTVFFADVRNIFIEEV